MRGHNSVYLLDPRAHGESNIYVSDQLVTNKTINPNDPKGVKSV